MNTIHVMPMFPGKTAWWPNPPKPVGGKVIWNSETMLVDMSTGYVMPHPSPDQWAAYVASCRLAKCQPYKRWPGMRPASRAALRSSRTHKYVMGGPFHGHRVRYLDGNDVSPKISKDGKAPKRMSRKIKIDVPILEDVFVVKPFFGRYEYDEVADVYHWCYGTGL